MLKLLQNGKVRTAEQNERISDCIRNAQFFKEAKITKQDNIHDLAAVLKHKQVTKY